MSGKDGFLLPYQYDYELAKISGAVYKDEDTIRESMEEADPDKRLLPRGWDLLNERFENTNAETGFVAGAFINRKTDQIVIAFRGSEPREPDAHGLIDYKGANVAIAKDGDVRGITENLVLRAGIQTLARQHAPDWHAQFQQGLDYAERILKQSQTLPGGPYTAHVTGHSLGGAIAQVTHEMFDLPGRTFDPGGAANLTYSDEFKAWRSQYYLHRDDGLRRADRDPEGQGFSNYLVNDSLVSRYSGSHVGRVEDVTGYGGRETFGDKASHHVKRRLDGPVGAIGSGFNVIELHDMDRIIRVFREAQQTGELNRLGVLTPQPSEPDILRPGNQGRAVANLQSGLIQLGYDHRVSQPLQANGTYNEATRQAVTAFQALHEVEISGAADPATQHALHRALLAQQQAQQRQAEREQDRNAQDRDPDRVAADEPAQAQPSPHLRPFSHPDHPQHALYADVQQRFEAKGVDLSEAQLSVLTRHMHSTGATPGWQGDVTVRDGKAFAMAVWPPGVRANIDLGTRAPSVLDTLKDCQVEQQSMAKAMAEFQQQAETSRNGPRGPTPG